MNTTTLLQPNNRGRVALNSVGDRNRTDSVAGDDEGVVNLTTVSAVLSDEQLDDLRADPTGFMALLGASERHRTGEGRTVSIDEAFADLD